MALDQLDNQAERGLYTRFEDFYLGLIENGYETSMYPSELFFLYRIVDGMSVYAKRMEESVRIIDLGTYHGASAMVMATAMESRRAKGEVITVDLNSPPQDFLECVDDYIQFIEGDIMKIADTFEDESANLIFVDDTHEYHHVKRELGLYYPKVMSNKIDGSAYCNATCGGIICGHDYSPWHRHGWNMAHAVEEFKEESDWVAFGTESRIWWLIK